MIIEEFISRFGYEVHFEMKPEILEKIENRINNKLCDCWLEYDVSFNGESGEVYFQDILVYKLTEEEREFVESKEGYDNFVIGCTDTNENDGFFRFDAAD